MILIISCNACITTVKNFQWKKKKDKEKRNYCHWAKGQEPTGSLICNNNNNKTIVWKNILVNSQKKTKKNLQSDNSLFFRNQRCTEKKSIRLSLHKICKRTFGQCFFLTLTFQHRSKKKIALILMNGED